MTRRRASPDRMLAGDVVRRWAMAGSVVLSLLSAGSAWAQATAGGADKSPPPAEGEPASADVRKVTDWIALSADNHGLPFAIVDKVGARVLVFDGHGMLLGTSPVLLGLARGDVAEPGIGDRKLSTIRPDERITPAGRFVAAMGQNLGSKDVLWVDYASAVSMHRVVTHNPRERRLERLATATTLDNRISYGCINVPVAFFDSVVKPSFTGTDGIVYVLPEVKAVEAVFSMTDAATVSSP